MDFLHIFTFCTLYKAGFVVINKVCRMHKSFQHKSFTNESQHNQHHICSDSLVHVFYICLDLHPAVYPAVTSSSQKRSYLFSLRSHTQSWRTMCHKHFHVLLDVPITCTTGLFDITEGLQSDVISILCMYCICGQWSVFYLCQAVGFSAIIPCVCRWIRVQMLSLL